ncbi:MAG TPA: amino acid ABC transporter permease [Gaiellales bacterium]|jgi:polar amino acid transport system permease protein|nr:amino acid ABC transporter permease [Gaiellales bacterium]
MSFWSGVGSKEQPAGMPEPDRRSRLLGGGTGRNVAIATVSTIVFFAVIALVVINSPGWPEVKQKFFDPTDFHESLSPIAHGFVLNIKMFCIAEVLILAFALLLAVLRSLPGPVFFPVRLLAIAYTDLFRGVPTILVVLLLGFGAPSLDLTGVPTSYTFWAVTSLVLVYTAYVSEVYRAGIESVHPSQEAAARSLGLTRAQTLRYVIIPQAVRRVIPPLLNDFIGLQKDTALLYVLGGVEALNAANILSAADFNFTPYVVAALFFIALTIPLARFTDYLVARERRRRESGAVL